MADRADIPTGAADNPPGPSRPDAGSLVPLADGLADGEWHEVSGLVGSLAQLTPMDLVQLLQQGQRTATVELRSGDQRGLLGMERGQVRHCTVHGSVDGADGQGIDAFFGIAFWDSGTFRVRYRSAPATPNITIDTTLLLLEAACRHDENGRCHHGQAIQAIADMLATAVAEPTDKPRLAVLPLAHAATEMNELDLASLPELLEATPSITPSGLFQRFFVEAGQTVMPAQPSRMPFMSTMIDLDEALDQEIVDDIDGNRTARERKTRAQASQ